VAAGDVLLEISMERSFKTTSASFQTSTTAFAKKTPKKKTFSP